MHQVVVVGGKHLHGIEPSRLKILDGLRKCVRPLWTSFHPEKGVANMFRVGWATESHVATFNSSISRKTFGSDTSFFCGMKCPTVRSFLEISIPDMTEQKRLVSQPPTFSLVRILP